jgi:ankyrin repeat protein
MPINRALLSADGRGADPLAIDRVRGDTALHYAARAGWPKLVDLLLAHGVDVDHQALRSGDTALHYAASIGSGSVIELLAKEGANLDLPNHLGIRPMQYALRQGHHRIAKLLISLGARPDDLQDAVNAGDIARIQYFLAQKVDVNAPDLFGTPLHRSAATGQAYIANMLIDVVRPARDVHRHPGFDGPRATSSATMAASLVSYWKRGPVTYR